MVYPIAADMLVLFHFAFILFVVVGGLMVFRWPRVFWLHIPAAVWGAVIEFTGWICPLTPLENRLRLAAGHPGLKGGFIDEYIVPVVYPTGLTHGIQLSLGVAVIAINIAVYGSLLWRRSRQRHKCSKV